MRITQIKKLANGKKELNWEENILQYNPTEIPPQGRM